MIRVLWVTKGLGPGGAERLLVSVARAADRTAVAYEAAYVMPEKGHLRPALEAAGVPVRLVGGRRGLADIRWPARVLALARDVDVVHIHSPAPAAVLRPLLRARRRRPAIVFTQHNLWASFSAVTRAGLRLTGQLDDRAVAVSEEVAASLPTSLRRRTEVIVHGIPVADLDDRRHEREAARVELGAGDDDVVVGMVANLRATKDHPTMLAAAETALAAEPRLRFVVVGQGPLEAALHEALAARPALDGRFAYLGHREDVPRVLAGCDIFTLTSRHEGLPIALLEAMALGLPVVATAVGSVPAVATDGDVAILAPPRRPDLIADGLVRLARDAGTRARLGAAARDRAAGYDVADAARRLEALYAELTRAR